MAAVQRLFRAAAASGGAAAAAARMRMTLLAPEQTPSAAAAFPFASAERRQWPAEERNVQWVFLGCPGVGKGTYASGLSRLLGVPHIATGDLVRDELASSGPLSVQLAKIVNQGKLVSDEIIINLFSKRLKKGEEQGESGFILDGFPRTVKQAKPLAPHLLRLFTSHSESDGCSFHKPFITFVLGGPGSGKGTQCSRIASNFGFAHLSAGDLLRNEISSGSAKGELILDIIKEGRIVPSEITVELIRKAMESSNAKRVLIDGFPRCEENRIAFERLIGTEPDLVIFFDCPEDEMVKRLLDRNQGRVDDNIETIKKRLKVFESLNIPVVDYYSSRGKVHKINAIGNADEIFKAVHKLFSSLRL